MSDIIFSKETERLVEIYVKRIVTDLTDYIKKNDSKLSGQDSLNFIINTLANLASNTLLTMCARGGIHKLIREEMLDKVIDMLKTHFDISQQQIKLFQRIDSNYENELTIRLKKMKNKKSSETNEKLVEEVLNEIEKSSQELQGD